MCEARTAEWVPAVRPSIGPYMSDDLEPLVCLAVHEYGSTKATELRQRLLEGLETGVVARTKTGALVGFNTYYCRGALTAAKVFALAGRALSKTPAVTLLAGGTPGPSSTFAHWLYVRPQYRRLGIGRALKVAQLRMLQGHGVEHVFTTVRNAQSPADALVRWFLRLSFVDLGVAYKSDRRGVEMPYHLLYAHVPTVLAHHGHLSDDGVRTGSLREKGRVRAVGSCRRAAIALRVTLLAPSARRAVSW